MKTLFLFDVDGTLTKSRNVISKEMIDVLRELKSYRNVEVGFVGGSDLEKQKEQLLKENLSLFDYMFAENGLVAYKNGKLIFEGSLMNFFKENELQDFLNYCLGYLSKIRVPKKRGTFIEFRRGLINISPIGRDCSQEERDEFFVFDKKNKVREKFIEKLKDKFANLDLNYVIGGEISFDVFPRDWDKTYCLNHLNVKDYEKIYFFGDKTKKGGNDYELYIHDLITGVSVKNYTETIEKLKDIMLSLN